MSESWKNKYPIGSQWKTRGGWRAVVVAHYCGPRFWHNHPNGELSYQHGESGRFRLNEFDPVEAWTEPRKGEFWANVYEAESGLSFGYGYENRAMCDNSDDAKHMKRIACVHVKWTEGEGLEDGD